jgi:hypothetical protein
MDPKNENIRERLLSHLPQPANLAAYRQEVASLLEKKEKAIRQERWVVVALWIFVVALSIAFLFLGEQQLDTPKGPWFGSLACFWFLFGMVFLVKHFFNRTSVDLLKEVKQVQVQVLELHALVAKGGA